MQADEHGLTGKEQALACAVANETPEGIATGCRAIRAGDWRLLLPSEARSILAMRDHMRDASGAAREVARDLIGALGGTAVPILRSASGAPVFPPGFVGSLAHDDEFAVAAVAKSTDYAALGIDVEPAEPLPIDVASIVRIAGDVTDGIDESLSARLLFSAKEAVYKAVFPRDRVILGYEDIVIDLAERSGGTRNGRSLKLVFIRSPRIVVLAYEPA